MIPLTDIPQQYHEALAAERVDLTDGVGRGTLLLWVDGVTCVVADGAVLYTADRLFTLPNTPRNVRALAVVLATARGLDASGGVTAGLVYVHAPHTDGLWIATADGARHAFWGNRTVPALSTIDPTTQDALLRALAECLRALTETT